MNLYLLRHGIAVDRGAPGYHTDADRPLTPKGERRVQLITKAMVALDLSFDVILSSPHLRARQTAEIVADALRLRKKLAFSDELTPGGNPKALVQRLNELRPEPKSVLLAGHEPYLGRLIALFTAGNLNMAIDLKKGGLCKLEVESVLYGRCATLAWLLTPRQMELMA